MKEVHFTPAQQEAIDISRRHLDTCVVAGPGSGKTTVLVEYFRRLVAEGIDPLRILAITFTEKAAGNMRDKLAKAFHDDAKVRARLERACARMPSLRASIPNSTSPTSANRGVCNWTRWPR